MKFVYKINHYAILAISLLSFWGALVYRLYKLNIAGIIISLTLVIISLIIIHLFFSDSNKNKKINKKYLNNSNPKDKKSTKYYTILNYFLPFLYSILLAACFYLLIRSSTTASIISPWQALPNYFFLVFSLASLVLFLIISLRHRLSLFFIILHYFLSFSIAVFVYKIGYGFDPFIHAATMKLIAKTGAVFPKPFYYLGQYSLIIIFHKLFFLPIVWLDKLLVPLLSSIFLPLALSETMSKWFKDKIKINLTILFLLILPFSFFIITTPQNLAYLFLLLIIIKGLNCENMFSLVLIFALSAAALAAHPLAGIPAILFALILALYYSDIKKYKKNLYRILFIFSIVSLPFAFHFLQNNPATSSASIHPAAAASAPLFGMPGNENFILNFIYLFKNNFLIIFILLIISGVFIYFKHKKDCRIFSVYFYMSLAMILAFLLTKNLGFNFLIDYERGNYTARILNLSLIFLFPFYLIAIYALIKNILLQNKIIKYSLLSFLLILISTSLYLSYPRFDNYFNSHGYSVSQADIDAVRWIDNSALEDYIVLANQQVSAAALREFGFKKYYESKSEISNLKSQIFYYPIPTGGPLYQYYLKMVYDRPTRLVVNEAMDLTGVNEAYFVLNKYWWAFPKILEEAKLEADDYIEINNGEVYVFKYNKK